MSAKLELCMLVTWLALCTYTSSKPVQPSDSITALLGDKLSADVQDKAEAIDNLLRLLAEIDLPSICDALAAKQKTSKQQVKTVDAILAQVARSQAMTFVPTNLPETRDVTRPGDAPVAFAPEKTKSPGSGFRFNHGDKVKRIFLGRDEKQASHEVTVSRPESHFGALSLEEAVLLESKKQANIMKPVPTDITVDVSVRALASHKSPNDTRTSTPKSNGPSTPMTSSEKTPSTPRPAHTTPRPSTQSTTVTTTVTTTVSPKVSKKDTTIPTLSSDMMLPSDGSFESGDGEITMDTTLTTEKYTTSKLEDEAFTTKGLPTFDNMLKNIFRFQDDKDIDLSKINPAETNMPLFALNKMISGIQSTMGDDSSDTNESPLLSIPTSAYSTPFDVETDVSIKDLEELLKGDYLEEKVLPTQASEEDNFTLPSNTTLAEYIFGNTTLNDNYSDDLASILNSTLPLDYLISNDTLYNEFMSLLNATLSEDDFLKQTNMSFDLSVNETSDYQNLIDYLSNMTSIIDPGMNFTSAPESTVYHTTNVVDLNVTKKENITQKAIETTAKDAVKPTATTFAAEVSNNDPNAVNTLDSRARVTDPARFEYADSSAPQYHGFDLEVEHEVEHGGHRHTHPKKTDFAAGDYYSNDDEDSKTPTEVNQGVNEYKHSGFAPVNPDQKYEQHARQSGLTYLGFDFKQIDRSPYTPKTENTEVAQLVNQKTIWSESTPRHTQKAVTSPAGYSCPGLFGYYGDAHDCKAFFICSWGVPYRFHCPPGTMWSSAESVCDWNRNVVCHESK